MGGIKQKDKHFEYFKAKRYDYGEANKFCYRIFGTQLAHPQTREDWSLIESTLKLENNKNQGWWLGLTRKSHNAKFKWQDGSSYQESKHGILFKDQHLPGHNCAALKCSPSLELQAISCDTTRLNLGFICRRTVRRYPTSTQHPSSTKASAEEVVASSTIDDKTFSTPSKTLSGLQSSPLLYAMLAFIIVLIMIIVAFITAKFWPKKNRKSGKSRRTPGLTDPSSSSHVEIAPIDGHYEQMSSILGRGFAPQEEQLPRYVSPETGPYLNEVDGTFNASLLATGQEHVYHDLEINAATHRPGSNVTGGRVSIRVVYENAYLN